MVLVSQLNQISEDCRPVSSGRLALSIGHSEQHLVGAEHYRNLRVSTFSEWSRAIARAPY